MSCSIVSIRDWLDWASSLCCYADLAALVLHETLLGARDRHVLLAS